MSAIHFIGGEKGGVGKSLVSRLAAQYLIDADIDFKAFDADQSNRTLSRFYRDYTAPVDLLSFESLDQIAETAVEENRVAIVDLPAQSARWLAEWMAQADLVGLAEEDGLEIVPWHVLDAGRDAAALLEATLAAAPEGFPYVVVKNQVHGNDFASLLKTDALAALEDDGGTTLELPRLHSPTMSKIDQRDSSFWAAIHDTESELKLRLLERRRVRVWMQAFYDQVAAANLFPQPKKEPDAD